jgi:signal transduction histidine kinase
VSVAAAPLATRDGSIHGLVLIVRDRREVAGLRLRLITSGRLAAVGELAAGIAHEINNPLAFVRANLGHLRREWELLVGGLDKPEIDAGLRASLAEWGAVLEESLDGVDRAGAIVRDVRDFSHAGGEAREPADLNTLVEAALRMATPQLARGVQIERAFGELPAVPCSPQRLKQLFLNLVVNAIQAVGAEGAIRVETRRSGERAVVIVVDDGCGIAPEDLERIFDPFFTTKPAGEGTGLGLAISHEIARSHGGAIRVESELGRGTRVRVELPLRDEAESG